MSSKTEAIEALASHIEATVKWEPADHPCAPGSEDADWMRGMLSVDPAKSQPDVGMDGAAWGSGGMDWAAWGYGSPCPEGNAPTRAEARAAACYAMAESFINAAAAHGVAVSVLKGGE